MNRRLEDALNHVQLPARGLFASIRPYLMEGEPFGTIQMDCDEIAECIQTTGHAVRQAMSELLKVRILIRVDGGFRCQFIEDERRNAEKRREIQIFFARVRNEMQPVPEVGESSL